METFTLMLVSLLLCSSFQQPPTRSCLTLADVEKVLGMSARETENLTSNKDNILQHKCSWKGTEESLNSNLYYLDEQHANTDAADKLFDDMVDSNRNNSGQSQPEIGDEAWLHSDGENFCLIMVRKGSRIMRMKVNKLTPLTSVEQMKRVAIEWSGGQ